MQVLVQVVVRRKLGQIRFPSQPFQSRPTKLNE